MKKILVVEDEAAIREFVVINLQRAGYDVTEADCGEKALQIYEESPDFDVAARSWYSGAIDNDDIYITAPYQDEQTGEFCITFSKRVIIDGKVIGVFGIDFYMDKLTTLLAESYSGGGYAFLVDNKDGTIITHPSNFFNNLTYY